MQAVGFSPPAPHALPKTPPPPSTGQEGGNDTGRNISANYFGEKTREFFKGLSFFFKYKNICCETRKTLLSKNIFLGPLSEIYARKKKLK